MKEEKKNPIEPSGIEINGKADDAKLRAREALCYSAISLGVSMAALIYKLWFR